MKRITSFLMALFLATTALWAAFTPAAFTVSSKGKQVLFSQGNLQCTGVTTGTYTWSFAENQYDILGGANMSGSNLADKIDLFGWSGSTGTAKWGISTSTVYNDYAGDFEDWGKNIGDGKTYRTLTKDEWDYILSTRTNASEKKGVARINLNSDGSQYANGLILLPDDWNCPDGVAFKNGFASEWNIEAYATYQTFSLTQWQQLESAGAVFLPAAGYRNESSMKYVQYYGDYWSVTPYESYGAYYLDFCSDAAHARNNYRYNGQAVRLVQDVKYAISLTQPEHGNIAADKTEAPAGETITLTLSPNDAYYAPKTVTVLQGKTEITTTAVAGTTNQYTFTMPAGEVTITAEFEKLSSAFTAVAFTVSADGKQVYFSQGNLQYTQSTTTWSFADYQTEMLGMDNVTGSTEPYDTNYGYGKDGTALADKIDLFGWSANNETAKWGISTSIDYNDYAGDFEDWGKNIGDGKTYRTLTKDEWDYLLSTRTNASEKKGVARIKLSDTQYVNGLILLPDSWTCPDGVTFKSGFASDKDVEAYAPYQTFTLAEWQKLEAAGAVFLPASGSRNGSSMHYVQGYGYCWTATESGSSRAYYLLFNSNAAYPYSFNRNYGQSVRLVQDMKYAISLTQPEHGNIAADKTEAPASETITLTITPNDAYYAPKTVTVLQGETPVTTTAVAGTTNQYTFTMPAGEVNITAEFEKLSSAFTAAAFTIAADGKQVYFSQGNLQCAGVKSGDYKWSFADYQTDMLGEANVSGSTLADKIDLFGWSGSTGTAKWGISTSTDYNDYAGDFEDWGKNIGDGSTYHTLTNSEWEYLLNTRTNASEKRGVARIKLSDTEYANGLILLPDSWTCPADITFKSGLASEWSIEAYATYQTFTLAEWQQLEAAGAVFLPASGDRDGSSMLNVQSRGRYWSATAYGSSRTYYLYFRSNEADAFFSDSNNGQAVRLVQDIKYAISLNQPEHGSITADKTEAPAGETITLTITPNDAYYAPKTVTVLQGETPVATTAVEGTTNQYTFTMPAGEVTITAEFEKLSSAFTPAAFTVSAEGKQVTFSQGNLQCAGVTSGTYTWSFADYQTEMLGEANVTDGTESYNATYGYSKNGTALADKIDLFGWNANNETTKWGISTSQNKSDYSGNFVDWGTNTIGTAAPNTYRTLTNDEWKYLLNTRTKASEKRGVARIKLSDTEYANGLILLPDSWTCPEDVTFKSGFSSDFSVEAYATYQTFTLTEWQKLESAGAVFLPASGERHGSSMDRVQYTGSYWSATAYDSYGAGYLYFRSFAADADNYYRYNGQAVRLVQDVKYAISLTQPEHGTIAADKTEAAAGETITLTITPATGYELEAITVKDANNGDVAVEGNKFTMPASNVTISATFKKVNYTITIADGIANGKVSVTSAATTANYGDEVELTITPDKGYELDVLTVKDADNEDITVANNKFTMPASNVTVSATFKVKTATALATTQALDLRTENGRVICAQEFQIFDLLGRNVTRLNGSLNGVYIVKVGDKAQKVVVK